MNDQHGRRRTVWVTAVLAVMVGVSCFQPVPAYSQAADRWELLSVGIRGGLNLPPVGIPPGEKEDFEQYEAFGIIGFPESWEWPSGWETRWRLNVTAGVIRGAGDVGFVSELTPGIAFTNWEWNITLDFGTGFAYFGDETFGSQDFGGPFQIVGHGGLSYHFPGNVTLGWRFHHISDATLYGSNNRGVDFHFLELSYRF